MQKTEDSLRRLKQIREKPQPSTEKTGTSDDDKIRIQLKVDVDNYVRLLSDMKLNCQKIERLSDLLMLTEKAVNAKSSPTQ